MAGVQWKAKTRVGEHILGIAAVNVVASEPGMIAKIFVIGCTVLALTAGPPKPCGPDTGTNIEHGTIAGRGNFTNDLVARDYRVTDSREFSIDEM